MTGAQVDVFSQKLNDELASLPREEKHELLVRIGRMEARMRADGQDRPIWRGAIPQTDVIGLDVVIPTDHGDRRGRAVYFGIARGAGEYETSVVVYSGASGTIHEAPGSLVRPATVNESERYQEELTMAERLKGATAGITEREERRRSQPSRPKWAPDPGLIERMIEIAKDSNYVVSVEEVGGCHKITGIKRERRVYVHKRGLRVDISGFEPTTEEGVIRISPDEAKRAHLGKVRAQIDFTSQNIGMQAFDLIMKELA
jgi:hypothetical protein